MRMEIAEAYLHQPALITPDALAAVADFVAGGRPSIFSAGAAAGRSMGRETALPDQRDGYRVHRGTAVIDVVGSLLNRPTRASAHFGIVTYRDLLARIEAARTDPEVRRIVLDIDSHGGMVAGAFDLADAVFAMRGIGPPIIAAVNETAASAAYLIAAAASEVVIPMTARLGSIGVVVAHLDVSKAMDAAGYAMTYVHAGAKKIDGHPYAALPQRVRDELQARVDDTYALFVDRVAQFRGIASSAVRATRAGMFTGASAVAAGLASRVDSFRAVLDNKPVTPAIMGTITSLPASTPMTPSAAVVASSKPAPRQRSASEIWDLVLAEQDARLGPTMAPAQQPQPIGDASDRPAAVSASTSSVWDQVHANMAARRGPAARRGTLQSQAATAPGADTEGATGGDCRAAGQATQG